MKSTERLVAVQFDQVLRLFGLLMNFGGETFRDARKRVANRHNPAASKTA